MLAASRSVAVDAVFVKPAEREVVVNIASDPNIPCSGVWWTASGGIQFKRAGAPTDDASDATLPSLNDNSGKTLER